MVDRIDAGSLRVRSPSAIILLCGGQMGITEPKPASLRSAYTRIYHKPELNFYNTVIPEDFKIFAPDGDYLDWLSFESDFAQIVELIVLFSESFGSVAELGAFSMDDEISRRLLVVIDDKNYAKESFIRLGPLRRLERIYGKSAVCVLKTEDLNIEKIDKVEDVDLTKFTESMTSAIKTRRASYVELACCRFSGQALKLTSLFPRTQLG